VFKVEASQAKMTTVADAPATTTPGTISELGPFDVLCGRDKKCSSNAGNRRFRALINANLHRYLSCDSKFERSKTIGAIAKEIQDDPRGSIRFFKRIKGSNANDDNAKIELLDEKQSREKVAHALRDYASQRRNNQAKQQAMATPAIPLDPGLNPNVIDLCAASNNNASSTDAHPHGTDPSPRLNLLMQEAAKIRAEINALERSGNPSMPYLNGSVAAPTSYNEFVAPINNGYVNNGNHQIQNYYQEQPPQDEENEGSEGYDDFNIDGGYNAYSQPLGSEPSTRHLDSTPGAAIEQQINDYNQRIENHHQQQQQKQQQQQQQRQQPQDEASEGYDNFDVRLGPLPSGSSFRRTDAIERTPSNRSVESQGSFRRMADSFGRTSSNRSVESQGSFRRMADSFGRTSSNRSVESQGSFRRMDLGSHRQLDSTLHASNRSVKAQGSLRHMDVFERSASNRSVKAQGSLRHMDVFERSASNRSVKTQDSMAADLMLMSMETLSLNQSDMNESEVFPMGESTLSFDQSKFDMSVQSKLDMSVQTMDTNDFLGQKQTGP